MARTWLASQPIISGLLRVSLLWCAATGGVMAAPVPQALGLPTSTPPATAHTGGSLSLSSQGLDYDASIAAQHLDEKRESVGKELRVAMIQKETTPSAPADTNRDAVDLLKQIDVVIAQQQSAKTTLADLEAGVRQAEEELLQAENGVLDLQPPFSVLMLDQLKDELETLQSRAEGLEASRAAAREQLAITRSSAEEKDKLLRLQTEKTGGADTPEVKQGELAARLAHESVTLRRSELNIEEQSEKARELKQELTELKLKRISDKATFSKRDLAEPLAEIDKREDDLKRQLQFLQTDLHYAEQQWTRARAAADAEAIPAPALLEEVASKKVSQQVVQQQITRINQRLQQLPDLRTTWQRRFALFNGQASREEKLLWREEGQGQIDQLDREARQKNFKIDEVRSAITELDRQIAALPPENGTTSRWLQARRLAFQKQIELASDSLVSIASSQRTHAKLLADLDAGRGRPLSEYLYTSWVWTKRIWNTELSSVDENPITVGKIISGILLLGFGYLASIWLSALLGRKLPKLGVDEAGAHAIESLAFYSLLVIFGLTSLHFVNVPLTVFTFLGGAIAIGVGFGSQNILNNFISGLILLAERPVKVGDLIQLDNLYGNVKHIGARSTRVRTGDNLEIVVPNSKFLENNVVNLTRSDDRLRTKIVVGIAYGSPVKQAMALLEQAAEEHPSVHPRPAPFCWFCDFGDNALIIELHFWITTRTITQRMKIESDIRVRVDEMLREAEISIAFPQRDLHIQTLRPLDLRILRDSSNDDHDLRKAG